MSHPDPNLDQGSRARQRQSLLRPESIRSKILVLAIVATLLPSFATAWFSYRENRQSLEAKASEELLAAGVQSARELDLWIKERRYDLRVFASSYEVTENLEQIERRGGAPLSTPAHRRLTDYLRSVRERFTDYGELMVVDRNGRVVATSHEGTGDRLQVGKQSSDPQDRRFTLGRPYWNPETARPEVLVLVPLGVSGASSGFIAARVSLLSLAETLRHFAPGESGDVYLLDGQGDVSVHSGDITAESMSLRYPAILVQSHLAVEDGRVLAYVNARGQQVFGSMRAVPEHDWRVVAELPRSEVFGALDRLRDVTFLIVAGMLLVASVLGYALGLFIVRPLVQLTRGAAKVASGDLDVDLPVAAGGEVGELTSVFNNMVARLRKSRAELERLSVTDYLTGLNNRRRLMEALEDELLRSRRLNHPFAVLIADVDGFKQFNDALGHLAGDEVLQRVAGVMRKAARDVDFLARYGGEEFFVIMPELDAQGAAKLADRMRQKIAEQEFAGSRLTVSIGVAEFPAHGSTAEALIAAADAALYDAKRGGRNRAVVAELPVAITAAGR